MNELTTYDGLVYDERVGWYDPDEEYCIEGDCMNPATHERIYGMFGENFIFEKVCIRHIQEV